MFLWFLSQDHAIVGIELYGAICTVCRGWISLSWDFFNCPEIILIHCVLTNTNRYHADIQLSNSFVIHRWTGDYMAKKWNKTKSLCLIKLCVFSLSGLPSEHLSPPELEWSTTCIQWISRWLFRLRSIHVGFNLETWFVLC